MLTKDQVKDFMDNNREELNRIYSEASSEEQDQYIAWINELNPIEEPSDEKLSEDLMRDIEYQVEESRENEIARLDKEANPIQFRLLLEAKSSKPQFILTKEESNRRRAARGNMLRRLKKAFRIMQPFTIGEAAFETSQDVNVITAYLVSESILRGSQIGYNRELQKYYIVNPFS